MKKVNSNMFKEGLADGLKYPWNNGVRLWNILWVLVPIFGWFALIGYGKRIMQTLARGENHGLPAFGKFWKNFKEGVMTAIYLIPTAFAIGFIDLIPFVGDALQTLVCIFLVPWLVVNFFMKGNFDALWDVKKAFNVVFNNAFEYVIAYIKTLVYVFVYGMLSFVLVGIPALAFGNPYFLADFYRRHH